MAPFIVKTFVAASTCVLLAMPALAVTRGWTGAVNGNWSEPGNWDPAGVPQYGDLLYFWDGVSVSHTTMVNDIPNLSCTLAFDNTSHDFFLSGNAINVSEVDAVPGNASLTGYDQKVTIACPLVFPNGGTIDVGPAAAADLGENKETLNLNGGIQVGSGKTIFIHAEGNAGMSGHVYIVGALSGNGDVSAHTDEVDGSTKGSIEFDSAANGTLGGRLWLSTDGDTTIDFNQPPGVAIAPFVGVHNGATANLRIEQTDQSGTTLDIESGGRLFISGENATFDRVSMQNSASDSQASTLNTQNFLLGLNGGIIAACNNDTYRPTIQGRLNLNGPELIELGGTATVGLDIPADIEGDGFQKYGNPTLILEGTNTFTGTAEVDEGTLDVRNPNALSSGGADTLINGGLLLLRNSISGVTLTAGSESLNADNADFPGASMELISANPIAWSGPVVLDTNLDLFGDDITFSGTISGGGGLGFFNLGTAQITGGSPNTFGGELLARCPLLELNKSDGIAAFAGPLDVGGGFGGPFEVRWLQSNQALGAKLEVDANGVANLNNYNDSLTPIVLDGGEVDTGLGMLTCSQVTTISNISTAVINGNIQLSKGNDTFEIADGAAEPDLLVNAAMSGHLSSLSAFFKTGPGTLALAGANTFTGDLIVEQGTVSAENNSALGDTVATCEIVIGAKVQLDTSTIANTFSITGQGGVGPNATIFCTNGSCTLSGLIDLGTPLTVDVSSTASISLTGVITGQSSLTKTGAGTLTLAGSSPNNFSGDVTNQSGLLYLSKSGATPIAVPGNLILGPAPADEAASAILLSPNSIGGAVTVNANSALNLNGRNQTLSQLALHDGGNVYTGTGQLILASGATVSVGSLSSGIRGGLRASASIQGNIELTPNGAPVNFDISPYESILVHASDAELEVPATISVNGAENPNLAAAGITKNGSGRIRLSGANTYTGATTVNGGILQVDGSLGADNNVFVNSGTVKGDGSLGTVYLQGASATLEPGDGPGSLTGDLDVFGSGFSGVFDVELNGPTPGSQYDQLKTTYVNLNGIRLNASVGYVPATNDQFTIIADSGVLAPNGTFAGLPEGAALNIGGQVFHITYHGGAGHDVVLTEIGPLVIPQLTIEPAGANLVRLLWPTNALAFELQSTTNLENQDATNWLTISSSPVIDGTNNVVTNAVNGADRFYRLFAQ
ncbi:MAG TPA: autotransporter-associated beta strand repeat-containing protein [Candidatus Angelobacter sp.]|nr:autotransporter-associated beta strand repeat-containing protein [Candidatus Angelobacter sp.]